MSDNKLPLTGEKITAHADTRGQLIARANTLANGVQTIERIFARTIPNITEYIQAKEVASTVTRHAGQVIGNAVVAHEQPAVIASEETHEQLSEQTTATEPEVEQTLEATIIPFEPALAEQRDRAARKQAARDLTDQAYADGEGRSA